MNKIINKTSSKSKPKNNNNLHGKITIGKFSIPKQKLFKIGGVVAAVIIVIWFINSRFWPWPSSVEIGRRLNEVIDACMYNERSRGCSTIQEKYSMSFEYCRSLADIPEIGRTIPVYGVAKRNDTQTREISYRGGDKTLKKYPYYGCASYIEDMEKDSGPNLLSPEPSTMALFALYKTPHYSTSGNSHQCTVKLDPSYNFLWEQIPNIQSIKGEVQVVSDTYKGINCNQLSELQSAFDGINIKLSSYSSSRAVQQFYKNYDDWAGLSDDGPLSYGHMVGCTFMGKKFSSLICQDNPENGFEERYSTNVFINEMRSYISTDDFTSKIVVTN